MMTQKLFGKVGLSRLVGVAALLALGVAVAHAQEAPGVPGTDPGAGGGRRAGRQGGRQRQNPAVEAFKATKPTADQQTKFDALQTKMRDDMMALRGQTDMTKMQDLNKKFTDDVNALLTPDQQKIFKLEMAKAQGNLLAQMETLDLTKDELEKVRPLVRDTQRDLRGLQTDAALSAEDRTTKTDTLLKDLKAKVRPLLSADKQTKLDALELKAAAPRGRRGGAGGGRPGGAAPGGVPAPSAPAAPLTPER